jgi:transcriptional regulator with XRE-family HTH domain
MAAAPTPKTSNAPAWKSGPATRFPDMPVRPRTRSPPPWAWAKGAGGRGGGLSEDLPLSPNQIAAYNLARARALRRWTQEQTAERLERYLGWRWSKANYSAAERAVTGRRPRSFDADDLLAFARTFELPITWFLLRPHGREPLLPTPDDPAGGPSDAHARLALPRR